MGIDRGGMNQVLIQCVTYHRAGWVFPNPNVKGDRIQCEGLFAAYDTDRAEIPQRIQLYF